MPFPNHTVSKPHIQDGVPDPRRPTSRAFLSNRAMCRIEGSTVYYWILIFIWVWKHWLRNFRAHTQNDKDRSQKLWKRNIYKQVIIMRGVERREFYYQVFNLDIEYMVMLLTEIRNLFWKNDNVFSFRFVGVVCLWDMLKKMYLQLWNMAKKMSNMSFQRYTVALFTKVYDLGKRSLYNSLFTND